MERYLKLVPSANRDKSNFIAMLEMVLSEFVAVRDVALATPMAYDLDTAAGLQLDVCGQWIGFSRHLNVPIEGVYFEWGTEDVGWGEGVWYNLGDPTEGVASLDDDTYRLLLKIKAAANSWDGSLEDAHRVLQALSTDGTYLFIQDNFDMTMTAGLSGNWQSTLFRKLIRIVVEWVKPATVLLRGGLITSQNGSPIFGWGVNNGYLGGWGIGAWGIEEK